MNSKKFRTRIVLPAIGVVVLGGGLALAGCGSDSTVHYEVTGSGPVTVDYATIGESGASSRHEVQPAPFARDLPQATGQFKGATMVVSQTGPNFGPVGCKITVGGKVVSQQYSQPNHGPESYANLAVCTQMPQPPAGY